MGIIWLKATGPPEAVALCFTLRFIIAPLHLEKIFLPLLCKP